jgi:hypothetical protein
MKSLYYSITAILGLLGVLAVFRFTKKARTGVGENRPSKVVGQSISFKLKTDRLVRLGAEQFVVPANTTLAGRLVLKTSDGPTGEREFDAPGYLEACFDFEYGGRQMRWNGFIGWFDLWAPNGTQTTFEDPHFIAEFGPLDGQADDRDDWYYIRADGVRHTNRLKYTSCHFDAMLQASMMQVKCRYYDQNPGIGNYVTIYYSRDLDDLLLRKDYRYSYDENGKIEDWDWWSVPYVTLTEPGSVTKGRE